jgi:hypothetical protein
MWPQEIDKFWEHILRLDHENRRVRFGMAVSDPFVESYASQVRECLVYGFFAGGEMHAAAEMRTIGERWPADAEAAFSVEHDIRDSDIEPPFWDACAQLLPGSLWTNIQ